VSLPLCLALAWALSALLFTGVTLLRLGAARAAVPGPTLPAPAVLLLRPLDEPTAQELENFEVPILYPGPLRHVVVSPYRPRLPSHVGWLYSDPVQPNRKVGHLLYALATLHVPGEVVLAVDADVAVDGALVTALARPVACGAAVCTAAPTPTGARQGVALAVQALLCWTQHGFLPLFHMSLGAKAVCGKALGLGTPALRLLAELGQHVGEDLELSLRLYAEGAVVSLADVPARVPGGRSLEPLAAVRRFSRWMRVLGAHRPLLFPTVPWLLCPTPLLVLAALLFGSPLLLLAVGLLLLLRTALAVRLCAAGDSRALAARSWPLGEGLLLWAFLHALLFREVAWRGRRFRLLRGGRMQPAVEEP
jgi:ceramide glucosyltransferase